MRHVIIIRTMGFLSHGLCSERHFVKAVLMKAFCREKFCPRDYACQSPFVTDSNMNNIIY